MCRCTASEQKLNIQEGCLKKEVKSQEQKKKDLEEVSGVGHCLKQSTILWHGVSMFIMHFRMQIKCFLSANYR